MPSTRCTKFRNRCILMLAVAAQCVANYDVKQDLRCSIAHGLYANVALDQVSNSVWFDSVWHGAHTTRTGRGVLLACSGSVRMVRHVQPTCNTIASNWFECTRCPGLDGDAGVLAGLSIPSLPTGPCQRSLMVYHYLISLHRLTWANHLGSAKRQSLAFLFANTLK